MGKHRSVAVVKDMMKGQAHGAAFDVVADNLWFNSQHVRATGASEKVGEIDKPDWRRRVAEDIVIALNRRHLRPGNRSGRRGAARQRRPCDR